VGDSADNIPGAVGVGPVSAKKLIESYETVEGVYENIEKLKGKQKENLENSKENVNLSKILATIILDVPIEVDLEESKLVEFNRELLGGVFNEMNFKNLRTRILGEEQVINPRETGTQASLFGGEVHAGFVTDSNLKSISDVSHNYTLINSEEELASLISTLMYQKAFCFDTETTGLDVIDSELIGISFSWISHEAYYLNMPREKEKFSTYITLLSSLFSREDVLIVGQNLKFDFHILRNCEIEVKGRLFDTMVAHYLVAPEKKHGLDAIAEDFLSYSKIKTEELIGKKGARQLNFKDIDPERVKDYACEDADITWQVYEILMKKIEKENLAKLAFDIEMPLVKVLMDMEHTGVFLDSETLSEFAVKLREELIEIEKQIFELAGQEFNIGSPKQLGIVLFEKLKIVTDAKKTKSKQYSTGEEVLVNLVDKHEIVQVVLDFRSLKKLLSTYVEALPKLIHPKTGRIHTSFNQTLVSTGRLSSNNPNLQNIPIREERGREIRRAFSTPSENFRFLSADYSQIELRLMAHLSGDEQMILAFRNNEDIHSATAAKVYGIDLKHVTKEMRSKAKTANFGIIYGISAFGLSQRMRIPRTEAKELIDGYFNTYPAVKAYMDESIKNARETGMVETMFGRKRMLPDILSRNSMIRGNAERNAINNPIQGSAADIIKIAMVKIHSILQKEGLSTKMIIQVHDELNFEVPVEEMERVKQIVKMSKEEAIEISVPLIVEMNDGNNWLEAH
jgi:DNA polymerase-1